MTSIGGISCWPWGDQRACRRTIEQGEREGNESFYERAGREGWRIGHADGQAYYVCPEHRDGVWDATRLRGLFTHTPFAKRIRRRPNRFKLGAQRRKRKAAYQKFRHIDRAGLHWILIPFRAGWAELRRRAIEEARRA